MQPDLIINLSSGFSFDMVYVEGGEFLMGDDSSAYESERPPHRVKTSSFYIGKYLVTQGLWKTITGQNPSRYQGDKHPVERVSWNESRKFIKNLSEITDKPFRLPTEAEWEYAARGGLYSQGFTYAGSDKLKQVGWYEENSDGETHDVGQKLANELGIYDFSGNVAEWCEDDWHDSYLGAPEVASGWVDAPKRSTTRILRGGNFLSRQDACRSAYRDKTAPASTTDFIGFRLCLSIQLGL